MKNKRVFWGILEAVITASLCACSLCGCSLAREEQETGKDRLIGVLVTEEHVDLFDMDGYLSDHAAAILNGGTIEGRDSSEYTERLYATVEKTGAHEREVTFEGVEGIRFFNPRWTEEDGESYQEAAYDEGICDVKQNYKVTDTGEENEIECTIYRTLPKSENKNVELYINMVYQTEDERIYLVPGHGYMFSGSSAEGQRWSTTLTDSVTLTRNGGTETDQFTVTVNSAFLYEPTRITLYQMDAASRIVKSEEYPPGELPETLIAESETAYFLVETEKTAPDGTIHVTRKIYEPAEENEPLTTFHALENGILTEQYTEVIWGGENQV